MFRIDSAACNGAGTVSYLVEVGNRGFRSCFSSDFVILDSMSSWEPSILKMVFLHPDVGN